MTDEERNTMLQVKRYFEKEYDTKVKLYKTGNLVMDTTNIYCLDHEEKMEKLEEDIETLIIKARNTYNIDFDYELHIDKVVLTPLFFSFRSKIIS